jgi:hypothetical protein
VGVSKLNCFSASERKELWRRWRAGDSVSLIARSMERSGGSIYSAIRECGGFSPREPKRRDSHLSFEEREVLSRGIAAGLSFRVIANSLNRAPSTISREVARNGGRVRYRAVVADKQAYKTAKRPKVCKLATEHGLSKIT